MESYYIQRTDSAPQWDVIPTLSLHNILWLPDANIRMTQQICYDDLAIYIHQRATEAHIRAMHHSPLAQVCEDSCMEFFFCPMPGDGRYFNFEWNLNGCLYLGFGTGRHHSVRLQPTEPTTQPTQPTATPGGTTAAPTESSTNAEPSVPDTTVPVEPPTPRPQLWATLSGIFFLLAAACALFGQ